MKTNKLVNWLVGGIACIAVGTSCDVEPSFYSQVVPETFYSSQDAVWERFNRPFTHWRWWVAQDRARWELQEFERTRSVCRPVVVTGITVRFIRNSITMSSGLIWLVSRPDGRTSRWG